MSSVWNMPYLIPTDVLYVHLDSKTRDCSKEGGKLSPVTQTGAGGIVAYLKRNICNIYKYKIIKHLPENIPLHAHGELTLSSDTQPVCPSTSVENNHPSVVLFGQYL